MKEKEQIKVMKALMASIIKKKPIKKNNKDKIMKMIKRQYSELIEKNGKENKNLFKEHMKETKIILKPILKQYGGIEKVSELITDEEIDCFIQKRIKKKTKQKYQYGDPLMN